MEAHEIDRLQTEAYAEGREDEREESVTKSKPLWKLALQDFLFIATPLRQSRNRADRLRGNP